MSDTREHRWAIDGIEEGLARIEEDGDKMITIPVHLLPPDVKEGQLLRVTRVPGSDGRSLVLTIALDRAATAEVLSTSKATMDKAMTASKKKDRGGDVSL